MSAHDFNPRPDTPPEQDRFRWHEALLAALAGLYPSEYQLEQMLDHLERMP